MLLFSAWALVGGFDWLARDDMDVTTAMLMMITGAMFGFFGALLARHLRAPRWWPMARSPIHARAALVAGIVQKAPFGLDV